MTEFKFGAFLAYRGKKGCTDIRCTHTPFASDKGMCYGWHCPYCHAPCSSQGHQCSAREDIQTTGETAVSS